MGKLEGGALREPRRLWAPSRGRRGWMDLAACVSACVATAVAAGPDLARETTERFRGARLERPPRGLASLPSFQRLGTR